MNTNKKTIGFIGTGNMNSAIIGGMIAAGYQPDTIIAADRNPDKLRYLQSQFGIKTIADNQQLAVLADVVVIGVKPSHIAEVCEAIAESATNEIIISIAAGITLENIARHFDESQAIIRAMPNTPCLIGQGAIGLCANGHTSTEGIELARSLFSTTGHVEIFADEDHMDLVTAISGSGPAYFFYIAEAMLAEAKAQGMSTDQAKKLIYKTIAGAAAMLEQSDLEADQLRKNVTSPGGTTAAALKQLQDHGVDDVFRSAIRAAVNRGQELAK